VAEAARWLWGAGEHLAAWQMAARSLAMFTIMLVLIRIAGVRLLHQKSTFDVVVAIMIGAVAARGIVGASPFASTVAACALLVVVHRMVAWLAVRSERFGAMVKGERVVVFRDGRFERARLYQTTISESDVLESLRLETRQASLDPIHEAALERCGRISFLKRS
jgi:uncharacterized membrane protein YcaP (DUF421 family)